MTGHLFNRTIFLWAGALAIAFLMINPRAALIQRVNAMNGTAVDCLKDENCDDVKAITQAREYYKILDQLYPDYGRGAEMEGICYMLLKQDDMAIKKFHEAIKHNPDLFWVNFELGKAYYRKGEYSEALPYFQSITVQDNNSLLKKATLSSLRQLSDQTRGALIVGLIDFVNDVKLKSYQMAIGCLIRQGDLARAQALIALGGQQFNGNNFFTLANNSLWVDNSRKEMLSWIDGLSKSKPLLHPWGRAIQPLREILYQ